MEKKSSISHFFYIAPAISSPQLNFFSPTIDKFFCNQLDFFFPLLVSSLACFIIFFLSLSYYIIPLCALMRKSTVLRSVTMREQINSLRDKWENMIG